MTKQFIHATEDSRPPKRGWCTGDYVCQCRSCGEFFMGHPKAYRCAACAYAEEAVVIEEEATTNEQD
jgi:hypothetical protein